MSVKCCSCGAAITERDARRFSTCRSCCRTWSSPKAAEPVLTMVDMGDGIYLSAQTVRKEDVDAFCARLREMAR